MYNKGGIRYNITTNNEFPNLKLYYIIIINTRFITFKPL